VGPAGAAAPHFLWTLVDAAGAPAPAAMGAISAEGVYQAPAALPGAEVWVRATLAGDPGSFGSARVNLVAGMPAAAPAGIDLGNLPALPALGKPRLRPGLEVPNPPFSLEGLSDARRMPADRIPAWRACLEERIPAERREAWRLSLREPGNPALPERRYALFHGLGMSSQRRLLNAYYENAKDLTSAEVFSLTPWIVLGLRNVVSATLIDVTDPCTIYELGFLMDAPLETIWKTDPNDAYVPMEGNKDAPYDQRAFRDLFKGKNPLSPELEALWEKEATRFDLERNYSSQPLVARRRLDREFQEAFDKAHPPTFAYGPVKADDLRPPAELLSTPENRNVNEVATFSRITHPDHHITLRAVVFVASGTRATAVAAEDLRDAAFYEEQARELARTLGLPFLDLRPARTR